MAVGMTNGHEEEKQSPERRSGQGGKKPAPVSQRFQGNFKTLFGWHEKYENKSWHKQISAIIEDES